VFPHDRGLRHLIPETVDPDSACGSARPESPTLAQSRRVPVAPQIHHCAPRHGVTIPATDMYPVSGSTRADPSHLRATR
jgi:hypothetical protein